MKKKAFLWSPLQIVTASFVAGPFAGCYMLGKNYKIFGLSNLAKNCYIVGLLFTAALFVGLSFIPEHLIEKIPGSIIPIAYSSTIYGFAKSYQKPKIEEKYQEGLKRHSIFRCLAVMFLTLLVQTPLLLLYFIFFTH